MPKTYTQRDAANGTKSVDLAKSGYYVLAKILGGNPDWEAAKKLQWEAAASDAIVTIEEARLAEAEFDVISMAVRVASAMGIDFYQQSRAEKLTWEYVVRHWFNIIVSMAPNVEESANEAVWRVMKKIEAAKAQESNGSSDFLAKAMEKVAAEQKPVPAPRPTEVRVGQMSKAYSSVIDVKIADYKRKIAALESLKSSISPEAEEALADIFNDFLNGE